MEPAEALREFVGFTFDYHDKQRDFVRLVTIENIHGAKYIAMHEELLRRGLESPYAKIFEELSKQRGDDWKELEITTRVPCGDFLAVRDEALKAHATQVDPTSPFWFGLPPEVSSGQSLFPAVIAPKSRLIAFRR